MSILDIDLPKDPELHLSYDSPIHDNTLFEGRIYIGPICNDELNHYITAIDSTDLIGEVYVYFLVPDVYPKRNQSKFTKQRLDELLI